jgi:cytoskeleton protein RodZ
MTVTPDIQDGAAEMDVPAAGNPVGEHLREAREALGLRVDDIAQALKLGRRQVEALEAGEWEHLPGVTFTRGFVRTLCAPGPCRSGRADDPARPRVVKPTANLDVPEIELTTMPDSGPGASRRAAWSSWSAPPWCCWPQAPIS